MARPKQTETKGAVPEWMKAGLNAAAEHGRTSASPNNGDRHAAPRPTVQELVARHLGATESCLHGELLAMDLAEPSWVVEGLVAAEGFTLLGGKKKLGKSWACLQIAQAVAAGVPCLGRPVTQGKVVYLSLEDGRRRLKSRLLKQQTSTGLPIRWFTRFPALDGDGMGLLMDLLDEERPVLLIIDTLAAAKTGKVDENAAGPIADLGNSLRVLAQIYKAAILATHHHGKLIGGDPGDDLRLVGPRCCRRREPGAVPRGGRVPAARRGSGHPGVPFVAGVRRRGNVVLAGARRSAAVRQGAGGRRGARRAAGTGSRRPSASPCRWGSRVLPSATDWPSWKQRSW